MTSASVLLILVGLFIIVNSGNIVGVFQGNKKLTFNGTKSTTTSTVTPNSVGSKATSVSGN